MKKIALFLSIAMNVFFILMLVWFWTCVPKLSSPSAQSAALATHAPDPSRHMAQEDVGDDAQAMERAPNSMADPSMQNTSMKDPSMQNPRNANELSSYSHPVQPSACTINPATGVSTCSSWCQWPGKMLHTVISWVTHMQRMMHHIAQHWHSDCTLPQESTQASITPQLASIV